MPPLQFSFRFLLFVIVPLTACAALAVRTHGKRLEQTGDPYDLAISGNGYLCVTDRLGEGAEWYVRGGRLSVDANGQLCLDVDGSPRLMVPNLHLPADTEEFTIEPDGRLLAFQAGQAEPSQMGQLELHIFIAQNIPDLAKPVVAMTAQTGPPIPNSPGTGGAGLLKQGFRETTPISLDWKSLGFLTAGVVAGCLAMSVGVPASAGWVARVYSPVI